MDDEQQKIKSNFAKNLKAEAYVTEMTGFWKALPELLRFMLIFIHDVFRSRRFKGSKILEIGSGPTVHSIASASAYFSHIVLSDYVKDNTEQLKQWLRGESNLKQFLEIPIGLEGYGNDLEEGRMILEARIRKNVKRVCRCDVFCESILLDNSNIQEISPPFDVVISCLCLEVAPKDVHGYAGILKRISFLLRPGGGLLICGFTHGSYWSVADKEFHHIKMKEEELLDALTQAGFGNIDMKTTSKDGLKEIAFKYDKLFCVAAEKL